MRNEYSNVSDLINSNITTAGNTTKHKSLFMNDIIYAKCFAAKIQIILNLTYKH